MARKKENDYFGMFVEAVAASSEAARMLDSAFASYDPTALPQNIAAMHKIEHEADIAKHDLMEQLIKEFLPPIDREDIMELSSTLDDVTDSIEDVLLRLYMYNILSLRTEAAAFARLIAALCEALERMMKEFPNFRKSRTIHEQIIEVNHLEEEGDRLYSDALRRLYTEGADAVTVVAWSELFDRLEKCCDKCEDVADVVERVILKNS